MDLLVIILGHLLTLCGALVALLGDTWDKSKPQFRRLTPVGWVAAIIATIGMGASAYQSYDNYRTERDYRAIAMDDIRGGWRQVASPWALTLWEVKGTDPGVSVSALREAQNHLDAFDKIDLGKTSRVSEYGNKTLGNLFCEQSSVGMTIMERAVQFNTRVLPPDVATAVRRLRQEPMFGRLLRAGCRQPDQPDYSLLEDKFNAPEGTAYLAKLIELGELLGVVQGR